ncbi:major tail protein [Curtobacterium phage Reje]|uniref:major tail protein n=1 Tax=Curtobacterium phage Reje TaxID=2851069 RepID=UPI00220C8ACA|nr:major tail protein [Curtobacterium phage Reje]QXG07815.1 major tail protein [Curtobacterium phage Reje]
MVDRDEFPRSIDADFTVWTPDTVVTLTNVPWDGDYKDVVRFKDQAALNTWINNRESQNTTIRDLSYARVDEPIRLEIPFTDAYKFNYIRVTNPAQPAVNLKPKSYYYFITGIGNTNPGVTTVTVQLDMFQTFGYDVKFGRSYIERGHIGIANSKGFDNYGRDYLTLPEGLDTGAELVQIGQRSEQIMSASSHTVMVISNTDLEADPGTVKNPTLQSAPGSDVLKTPSGASYYFFPSAYDFTNFIRIYANYPWVLQGIMSITAIPDIKKLGYDTEEVKFKKGSNLFAYKLKRNQSGKGKYINLVTNWRRDWPEIENAIPTRYRHLKKFFTSPYMMLEMTAFNGQPIVIKPELWNTDHLNIAIKTNFIAPGTRIVIYPRRYNAGKGSTSIGGGGEYYDDGGDYLETSTCISNLPQFAIMNNAGTLALANQAHSIAQQYKSADWSQQLATASANASYDNTTAGIDNSNYQAELGRWSNTQNTDIANDTAIAGAAFGAIGGIGMGAATGGAVGAGMGAAGAIGTAVNTGIGVVGRNRALGVSNAASMASQGSTSATAGQIRDRNYDLSNFASKGNYQQAIGAIQAKVQDTAMTPPTTAGQAGGDAFNFVFGGINLSVRAKVVPPAQMRAIGEYWLRYGYAVRQFAQIPASLQVMSRFTYWKLLETYLVGTNVPEGIKRGIRGIFEKGVTVYARPEDIGTIDMADNEPLTGVTL